jgi:type III restriction enzyme
LRIGDTSFQPCSEENVRDLLPVRAYSQKQLSAVGERLEELRRFVHAPVRAELAAIEEKMLGLRAELRSSFDQLQRFREIKAELTAHELERQSLTGRIEGLRALLKGVAPGDREIIARQTAYDAEDRIVGTLERDVQKAKAALAAVVAELDRVPTKLDLSAATENSAVLTASRDALAAWAKDASDRVTGALEAFKAPVTGKALGPFFDGISGWRARLEAHRVQYNQARSRAVAHEETLSQIATLEERLREINSLTDTKAEQLHGLGDPERTFDSLRTRWVKLHDQRADVLGGQCTQLTATPNSRLRATLRRGADVAPVVDHLKQLLRGTKARTDKVEALLETVAAQSSPVVAWNAVLDELLQLAWTKIEDEATVSLPPSPRLDAVGFTSKEKTALARQLQPTAWLELLLLDLKDLPVFEYQLRDEDYIPFQDASPGQQATALLSILLLQDGPPLLVDQPEDDLNMKVISEVVETLWNSKGRRQLIFASHNANLVVNGDAELVACCDYRTTSTESGGKIKLVGAIDVPEIKQEITEVMEGGVDAFKLRQQKYGF